MTTTYEHVISNIVCKNNPLFESVNKIIEFDPVREIENNIHFIWVRKSIPEKYVLNVKNCAEIHPSKNVFLWVDEYNADLKIENVNVRNIDSLQLQNSEYYDIARNSNKNIGAWQADILRYELVLKFGGIYSDIDILYTKPLDDNFRHSFILYNKYYKNNNNCFFGFYKNSQVIEYIVSLLTVFYKANPNRDPLELVGPPYFTSCIKSICPHKLHVIDAPTYYKNYNKHLFDANWINKKN